MRFTHFWAAAAVAFVPVIKAQATDWAPLDPEAFEVKFGFDNIGRYIAPIGMVRSAINSTHCSPKPLPLTAFTSFLLFLLGQALVQSWQFQLPFIHILALHRCGRCWLRRLCCGNGSSTSVCPSYYRSTILLIPLKVQHIKLVFCISPRNYTKL